MYLFISDMHFGRSEVSQERAVESALVNCLRANEETVEGLYLLGDVFDHYIEYRYVIPKGAVRFLALLHDWSDRGIPITYVLGNHDPWHYDYFEESLGARIIRDSHLEPLQGRDVYISHGDGIDANERIYRLLKPILRHPVPIWMYRYLLPVDVAVGLAKFVKDLSRDEEVKEGKVDALRTFAHKTLKESPADLVIMGHTHYPEIVDWPEGRYVNTGSFRQSRTFGILEHGRLTLNYWNGSCSIEIGKDANNAVEPSDVTR